MLLRSARRWPLAAPPASLPSPVAAPFRPAGVTNGGRSGKTAAPAPAQRCAFSAAAPREPANNSSGDSDSREDGSSSSTGGILQRLREYDPLHRFKRTFGDLLLLLACASLVYDLRSVRAEAADFRRVAMLREKKLVAEIDAVRRECADLAAAGGASPPDRSSTVLAEDVASESVRREVARFEDVTSVDEIVLDASASSSASPKRVSIF
ncbi:hypothetical protein HDU83_005076 [Entophlyctis luteolus]|nr:hypothetical protein HDU83_005076 [Entophlyctis luteolus]